MSCRVREQASRRRNTARSRPPLSGVAERRNAGCSRPSFGQSPDKLRCHGLAETARRDRRIAGPSVNRAARRERTGRSGQPSVLCGHHGPVRPRRSGRDGGVQPGWRSARGTANRGRRLEPKRSHRSVPPGLALPHCPGRPSRLARVDHIPSLATGLQAAPRRQPGSLARRERPERAAGRTASVRDAPLAFLPARRIDARCVRAAALHSPPPSSDPPPQSVPSCATACMPSSSGTRPSERAPGVACWVGALCSRSRGGITRRA